MPREVLDSEVIGEKFERLTVLGEELVEKNGRKRWKYICSCDCGNEYLADRYKLLDGKIKSCGCLHKKRGGRSKEFTYNTWNMMIQRCYNPKVDSYENYGAVGVKVCERWLDEVDGYSNFVGDMGPRPSENHTIDRLDVNANYTPENCVWTDDLSWQAYNQKTRKNNISGRTGVRYDDTSTPGCGKWRATICKNRKAISKRFHTFEEAVAQREVWELELYGFIKDKQ